ncbi:cupin domain-containing protein [Microbaculum marinum]|uniref:Cupin domain-containing protein n=1 Tax=Microbaculum marinum TaxID=1764581 RepID=A0AAW9RU05_9HYPH
MPRIDIASLPERNTTAYPEPFRRTVAGRFKTALGDAVALSQFGVNLTRIAPGSASSERHWHENEDEFVYVLEGELVLVEDDGETVLKPGDAAAFKAGVANGHHLVNRSDRDALILEVGTRAASEIAHYPDVDLAGVKDEAGFHFSSKSGEPYA